MTSQNPTSNADFSLVGWVLPSRSKADLFQRSPLHRQREQFPFPTLIGQFTLSESDLLGHFVDRSDTSRDNAEWRIAAFPVPSGHESSCAYQMGDIAVIDNYEEIVSCSRLTRRLNKRSGRIFLYASSEEEVRANCVQSIAFGDVPTEPPFPASWIARRRALTDLLDLIDSQNNAAYLNRWLELVVNESLEPNDGLSADSAATVLLKRMAELNFSYARERCRRLIFAESFAGNITPHFRLAAVGVLLDHYAEHSEDSDDHRWANEFFEAARDWYKRVRPSSPSLLAAAVALCFFSSSSTPSAGDALDQKMELCLQVTSTKEARKFFLQFLADSLSSFANKNLSSRHLLKLLVIGKYFNEKTLLWPESRFLVVLKKLQKLAFRPVVSL